MNPKQRKSLALDDVWKSEEEIKKISQISPHYSREIQDYSIKYKYSEKYNKYFGNAKILSITILNSIIYHHIDGVRRTIKYSRMYMCFFCNFG